MFLTYFPDFPVATVTALALANTLTALVYLVLIETAWSRDLEPETGSDPGQTGISSGKAPGSETVPDPAGRDRSDESPLTARQVILPFLQVLLIFFLYLAARDFFRLL